MRPDVNGSKATYAVDPKRRGIRKGLVSIKGIGHITAQEIERNQPFANLDDFAARCNPAKVSGIKPYLKTKSLDSSDLVGSFELLYEAGAFDSLGA